MSHALCLRIILPDSLFVVAFFVFADTERIIAAIEKEESIDRKHAQAMFIGPGGSGKSSLMDRMINKRRLLYISTGVANPVVIVDIDVNPPTFYAVTVLDSDRWEEVKFDKSLVGQMHEGACSSQQQQVQTKTSEVSPNPPPQSTASPTPESASVSSTTTDADREVVMASNPVTTTLSTSRPPVNDDIRQAISSAVTKHGGYAKFENLLKRKFSLYLRDAGGQVEFQEMVSLLVFGPSIFIFVFRADQGLKSTFMVGYRTSASKSINCYKSSITTEEALLQVLASVSAMDMPGEATSLDTHNPYVFIVATHKDKLGPSADQKIHELNGYLKSLIKESGFDNLVQYADRAKGEVMFAVDNTSESDEDFKAIRSKVHNLIVSREEFTIKYPISYLLFCLELQSDPRSVLTLEECRAMAAKYNIVGDKVRDIFVQGGGRGVMCFKGITMYVSCIGDIIPITYTSGESANGVSVEILPAMNICMYCSLSSSDTRSSAAAHSLIAGRRLTGGFSLGGRDCFGLILQDLMTSV